MATLYLVSALAGVKHLFWYDFRDDGVRATWADHFGLVEYDFSGKSAYRAYEFGSLPPKRGNSHRRRSRYLQPGTISNLGSWAHFLRCLECRTCLAEGQDVTLDGPCHHRSGLHRRSCGPQPRQSLSAVCAARRRTVSASRGYVSPTPAPKGRPGHTRSHPLEFSRRSSVYRRRVLPCPNRKEVHTPLTAANASKQQSGSTVAGLPI